MEGFSRHSSPFARAWAARAAAQAGATGTLEFLAQDPDPNVRTAAITGLARLEAPAATATYRAQLSNGDPQLVMTAVRLLPPEDPSVLPDVLSALERFTVMRRDNTRDVRIALLDFAGTSPALAAAMIEPYLQDFDPRVAQAAAAHLEAATGQAHTAAPVPLEPTPVPTPARLAQLERSVVVLEMAAGGRVIVTLRPDLAATNADRFARLAEERYFDGLTFHRVVPNFVIQGGSPGANEFLGDSAFSRDEISHESHRRGTVGLSTRGRDTGDAQIFVNLVDNPRLDFNYTIYGEVTEGMDVVDGLLEGAVIKKARLTRRRRP